MKKAVSAKVLKNWKQRIFKLQSDTLTLDYFDIKLYDKFDCLGAYSTPTVMSAHREAVDNDINPIWFQKKCRYKRFMINAASVCPLKYAPYASCTFLN